MAKHSPVQLDMAPMVDVAMLLLIFFMTTTSFKPPEDHPVSLPSSHSIIEVPESDVILITVGKDGEIYIGHSGSKGIEVPLNDFGQQLQAARMQAPSSRIVVKADRQVAYSVMADVMDAMQATNTTIFSLVTDLETTEH